jgi:hypothetical protein
VSLVSCWWTLLIRKLVNVRTFGHGNDEDVVDRLKRGSLMDASYRIMAMLVALACPEG